MNKPDDDLWLADMYTKFALNAPPVPENYVPRQEKKVPTPSLAPPFALSPKERAQVAVVLGESAASTMAAVHEAQYLSAQQRKTLVAKQWPADFAEHMVREYLDFTRRLFDGSDT